MHLEQTSISELVIVHFDEFKDVRGAFSERFHIDKFKALDLPCTFEQMNISRSSKNVLRGLHIQTSPYQAKLVMCITGEILDVAVDLRKTSKTYGTYFSTILNEHHSKALWIPEGFAHGFYTRSECDAQVLYLASTTYNPSSELTIQYDDPSLNIAWQALNPIVSERDKKGILLKEFELRN